MRKALLSGLLGCLLAVGCEEGQKQEQNSYASVGDIIIDASEDVLNYSCAQFVENENANNNSALLLDARQSANYTARFEPNSIYSAVIRYSNGFGNDLVSISANGSKLGEFQTSITGEGKPGWKNFVDSPVFYLQTGDREDYDISLKVEDAESIGAEFDTITFRKE